MGAVDESALLISRLLLSLQTKFGGGEGSNEAEKGASWWEGRMAVRSGGREAGSGGTMLISSSILADEGRCCCCCRSAADVWTMGLWFVSGHMDRSPSVVDNRAGSP